MAASSRSTASIRSCSALFLFIIIVLLDGFPNIDELATNVEQYSENSVYIFAIPRSPPKHEFIVVRARRLRKTPFQTRLV